MYTVTGLEGNTVLNITRHLWGNAGAVTAATGLSAFPLLMTLVWASGFNLRPKALCRVCVRG